MRIYPTVAFIGTKKEFDYELYGRRVPLRIVREEIPLYQKLLVGAAVLYFGLHFIAWLIYG
jgi:hypothetical protein